MGKDPPLLRPQALPVPLDETSKYLTALLDGTKQPKSKKSDKKSSRSGLAASAAARPPTTTTRLNPKVAGLRVYSLSGLPGATKKEQKNGVAAVTSKSNSSNRTKQKRDSAMRNLSSTRLPPPSSSLLSSAIASSRRQSSSVDTVAPLLSDFPAIHLKLKPAKPALPARISLECAPAPLIDKSKKHAGPSSCALQIKPTKRPRYSQTEMQGSSLSILKEDSSRLTTNDGDSIALASESAVIESGSAGTIANETKQNSSDKNLASNSTESDAATKAASVLTAATMPPDRPNNIGSVRQEIPRPESTADRKGSSKTSSKGNFVRLNMKNQAGACRGARNKKQPFKKRNYHDNSANASTRQWNDKGSGPKEVGGMCSTSGIDPVDDFLDGTFDANSSSDASKTSHKKTATSSRRKAMPNCSGHQQPCKLLTVKKNTENKGRQFYCCSFPRGDQCNHFEWADDTVEAAQAALLKNKSASGFIARQVASYMLQIKQHTVPELKELLERQGLDGKGKKPQLLTRIAVWVRDEVAKGATGDEDDASCHDADPVSDDHFSDADSVDSGDIEEESSDSSDDELEIVGRSQSSEHDANDDTKAVGTMTTKSAISCAKSPKSQIYTMLRDMFGHSGFRDGQEWAIRRCLNNERTLMVAPTGFGKSLCYTLTAALKDGVCIVVSPLLSLIQDQLRLLPPNMTAVTLSGTMTRSKLAATLDDIARGRIKIVFVSPERLTSASFRRLFRVRWVSERRVRERIFPAVSLFCVDEAHCLSQWAHNFRPSYLRLRSIVSLIQPQSVLAITATAGPKVVKDICHILDIPQGPAVPVSTGERPESSTLVMNCDRDNIDVACYILSSQEERLSKLMDMLRPRKSSKSKSDSSDDEHTGILASGSVIIYVWRQRDAEAVAENIQAADIHGGVTVYHGGMDAAARGKAQSKFMRGKIRICVATVAFGLGINKGDIKGVVHMYLSASPEHYLQEIGRAGRDGRNAHAIALVLADEVFIRHSLAHSDMISTSQVRSFVRLLSSCLKDSSASMLKESPIAGPTYAALMMADCTTICDCKSETVETLVSLLAHRDDPLVVVEGWSYDRAHIAPTRGVTSIAAREPVIHTILQSGTCTELPAGDRRDERHDDEANKQPLVTNGFGSYSFSVARCANSLGTGAEPRHIFAALRRMKQSGDIDYALDISNAGRGLSLKILEAGLNCLHSDDSISLEMLTAELSGRLNATVEASSRKVLDLDAILREIASLPLAATSKEKSSRLCMFQGLIRDYFAAGASPESFTQPNLQSFVRIDGQQLLSDVRSAFSYLTGMEDSLKNDGDLMLRDCHDYAALAVAKFLHGIQASARYPPAMMYQHQLFGRYQGSYFDELHKSIYKILND